MVDNRRIIIAGVVILIVVLIVVGIILLIIARRNEGTALSTTSVTCETLVPPPGVSASSNDIESITVSWSPVFGAYRYKVYLSDDQGFSAADAQKTKITDTTQAVMSDLTAGVTYYVFVTTIGSCGSEGVKSPEVSASVQFPGQFKIKSRSQPFYVYGTAGGSTTTVQLEADCQGVNNFCYWNYNDANKWITPVTNPSYCLVSFPDLPNPDRLELRLCSSVVSSPQIAQWNFSKDLGKLCHVGSFSKECSKLNSFTVGSGFRISSYDSSDSMKFDISV